MSGDPRRVAVAMGSNLGDRAAHLRYGILRLQGVLSDLSASAFIETAPHGVPTSDPDFLNAAVVGTSPTSPQGLLDALHAIECARGRERPYPGAPRTLDLDLILVGQEIVRDPTLEIPHPRFRERAFVLGPLCQIAPDLIDPETGLTVRDLLVRATERAWRGAT